MSPSPTSKSRNSPESVGRRLIVSADDFGASPGVNDAVAAAHDRGILTSASLLANAPAFGGAVGIAHAHPLLGIGVHLNLVRGRPLSDPDAIPLLVGGNGLFRLFRLRRLTGDFIEQAGREYRLQIERVLDAGISPTHVDFEKHHAWQGPLYRLACSLAREYGIPAARTLREPVAWAARRLGWPGAGRTAMAAGLRCGFDLGGGGGALPAPDRLLGQTHIGGMTEEVWLRLAAAVPPGVSEVMTHPGFSRRSRDDGDGDMGRSWLAEARERELEALLSARVRDALERAGVELVHFGELSPFRKERGA